jgi:hypothetical protein
MVVRQARAVLLPVVPSLALEHHQPGDLVAQPINFPLLAIREVLVVQHVSLQVLVLPFHNLQLLLLLRQPERQLPALALFFLKVISKYRVKYITRFPKQLFRDPLMQCSAVQCSVVQCSAGQCSVIITPLHYHTLYTFYTM